jgi:hypothetical protein
MSWRAVAYVRDELERRRDLTRGARSVLLVLSTYAGRDGRAWPSADTIGHVVGLEAGSVRRYLAELERTGIVAGDHRPGRTTVYRFPTGDGGLSAVTDYPQPRAPMHGVDNADPAHIARGPRAPLRDTPRTGARGIEQGSDERRTSGATPPPWCLPDCPECDGTAWVQTGPRSSAPCPNRGRGGAVAHG